MRAVSFICVCFLAFAVISCSRTDKSSPEVSTIAPSIQRSDVGEGSGPPAKKLREVSMDELGFPEPTTAETKLEKHRLGAGQADRSGWCKAVSTEGGFSVFLPNLFDDFTLIGKSRDGIAYKNDVVGTMDDRMVKYTAVKMKRADEKVADDALEEFVFKFDREDLKIQTEFTLGDLKGVEVRVSNRRVTSVLRMYRSKDTVYNLVAEAPSTLKFHDIEDDVQRFMSSFTVADKSR